MKYKLHGVEYESVDSKPAVQKRFNDLSTDGFDWQKYCYDNQAEIMRRMAAAGLESEGSAGTLNGKIIAEYASENNIVVSLDALFQVLTDARYNGRFVRIPPPPVVPKPRPTLKSLGYTRISLLKLSATETKQLLRNTEIGAYEEVERQYNEIVAESAEVREANHSSAAEKLHQLGYQADERPSHTQRAPEKKDAEQILEQKMNVARSEWDAAYRRIESLVIQQSDGSGRTNYARTEAAKAKAKAELGPRP